MFDIKQTRLAYDYGEIDAEQVNVLTVDKKNGRMYTAGQTSVKVWDIKARSMVSEIEGLSEKQITSMAITAGSKYLLVGSYDRRLTKIALETGTVEKVIDESHPGGVMAILTTTDGESVFTSGAQGHIKQWSLETLDEIQEFVQIKETFTGASPEEIRPAHDDLVQAIALTPDNAVLISGGWDKHLKAWLIVDGQNIQDIGYAHTDAILSIVVMSDGSVAFTGSADQKLKKWSIAGNYQMEMTHNFGTVDCIYAMCLSKDNQSLFTSGQEKSVKQWNVVDNKLFKSFGYVHKNAVTGIAVMEFIPDSQRLAEEEELERLAIEKVESVASLHSKGSNGSKLNSNAINLDGDSGTDGGSKQYTHEGIDGKAGQKRGKKDRDGKKGKRGEGQEEKQRTQQDEVGSLRSGDETRKKEQSRRKAGASNSNDGRSFTEKSEFGLKVSEGKITKN